MNFHGTMAITNCTISNNQTTNSVIGGGITNDGGTVKVKNTIVVNNTSNLGNNCTSSITNNGNNISNDTTCGFGTGDNVDPKLDPSGLQNNGGPTQTIALQSDSPAIDAIPDGQCTDQETTPNPITRDQRGVTRPQDGDNNGTALCDIGAFEVVGIIIIDGCNTGVLDQLLGNGTDITGQINGCAAAVKNHGQFVNCVSSLTNSLLKAGIINDSQKDAIQTCAGEASIP